MKAVPTGASQRLALTSIPTPDTEPKGEMADIEASRQVIEQSGRAIKATNILAELNREKNAAVLLGEAAEAAEPFWVPSLLAGELIDWLLKTGAEISNALAGDPPRTDYQTRTAPEQYPFQPAQSGQFVPDEIMRAAGNAEQALLSVVALLHAAEIAKDRFAGAAEAGDETWMRQQSDLCLEYTRQAGEDMVTSANILHGLRQDMDDAGYQDISLGRGETARGPRLGASQRPSGDRDRLGPSAGIQ